MSIFLFTVLFGFMCLVSAELGITHNFIIVVIIGFIVDLIYTNLPKVNVENNDDLKEVLNKIFKEKQNIEEETQKTIINYDFLASYQIPVKINKDTKAYVIDAIDVINAVDKYYRDLETSMNKQDNKKEKK